MKRAFTLIELLVVVLIIGILSAIALPQYQKAVEKAHFAEILQTMSALQRGIDMYLLESGYPSVSTTFLGEGANGQNVLTIDVAQGMTCDTVSCHNKYFLYQSGCSSSSCWIHGSRISPGDDDYKYHLYISKPKDEDWGGGECDYQDGYEYLCKALEPQGYTRTACC